MDRRERIAIVGMGGVFPRSPDPDRFWANIAGAVDATSAPPPGRWLLDPAEAYDPKVGAADRVYSTRGGFIEGFAFDPEGLDLDPDLLDRLDPMFHLALHAARQAWCDARTEGLDRRRVGVVFGNIALPTEAASALGWSVLGRTFAEKLGVPFDARDVEPLNAAVTGAPAGLVARALGLRGGAYTLDAACASSLYALKLAADELLAGRADAMLTGGVSRPDPLYTQMGFAQLRALSSRGKAHPFDARADGLVVGEGAGMFVLKRLSDALRDGDAIHAVIAGAGLSNDIDGGLLAPHSEGQSRALRAAYDRAGWDPRDVDFIECHATGTPVGDAVEFASLRALWGHAGWSPGQCVLGSVKANIGHALTAAGAAGLLKVLLALKHQVLPPTPNFATPAPGLDYDGGPFRILTAAQPWKRPEGRPRRAAISGFGFGGINAHVLIEEWEPAREAPIEKFAHGPTPLAIVGMGAHVGPRANLRAFQEHVLGGGGDAPDVPRNAWGVPESDWVRGVGLNPSDFRGHALEGLILPLDRFRVPPKELEEMLPQQLLMLKVASEAIGDAGWDDRPRPRTGLFVGIELDLNTTNFHCRWALANQARMWNEQLGLGLSAEDVERWTADLRAAIGPPLTANRTMGALGGLVAGRIAREYRIGGPSFTVSSGEASGLRALEIAARLLEQGEIDEAVVGAVDLPCDPRATIAARGRGHVPADGAAALVVKRLDDARRAGDKIYAIVQEMSADSEVLEKSAGSIWCGAASGLLTLVQAALSLDQQVLPDGPRFWLRDRADGPRRVAVRTHDMHVVLEESESDRDPIDRLQPLGARHAALFAIEADDPAGLLHRLDELEALVEEAPIEALARRWWRAHPNDPGRRLGLALVADSAATLRARIADARRHPHEPQALGSGLAFVYPGLGNGFAGMGRELGVQWPEVLRRHDAENQRLRAQLAPDVFWGSDLPATFDDHRAPILGQVALGCFVTDLLRGFGVEPDAAIGYSLGESAALVALRAWTHRDELLRRLDASPLFRTELAGPCDAARRLWGFHPDWRAGIVPCAAETVRKALEGRAYVYLLIVNTPREVVVGGHRPAVEQLVADLGAGFFPLPVVSTVHCAIAQTVAAEYRALHLLPTTPPPGVRFYSAARAESYPLDSESAAESIVAHAVHGFDFPAVVERAYADGVRTFVEVGPGGSCTRLIDAVLGDRPHLARSACLPGVDAVPGVLDLLARLIAARVHVNLASLYGQETRAVAHQPSHPPGRSLRVLVGGRPFDVPPLPVKNCRNGEHTFAHEPLADPLETDPLGHSHFAAETAKAEAHEAYLRTATNLAHTMSNQLAFQMALIETLMTEPVAVAPRLALDRHQCLEFAVGSIGAVLGPDFDAIDAHPTRVRLPDEPLMLVDRILTIEGTPRSLHAGRVVTEHDVRPDAWYLDCGRAPTCIAVEAGQADLFLSAYLGIDFHTKGRAVYRLLDAVVTFHGELPGPGAVIRYDIHIDEFFQQGDTYLFRFRFEGTVAGAPLLTMRDGCAGFFTVEALAAGQGVVTTALDRRPVRGIRPEDWEALVPQAVESYDDRQVEALRQGDLAAAFGPLFGGLDLADPLRLPGARMTLVHRVLTLEPEGGRYALGRICAEADIHPDDWFMTCHFVDDQVMPGTLMYECCLHTLRIYLMRLGWVGDRDSVVCGPVPGVASRLKCRGQVIEATKKVTYEVSIKEIGYRPEPYAIVDALMSADGKPIVEISDMSVRMTGLTREGLQSLWADRKPVVRYDRASILAFATGKPSEAFGAPYRVFDEGRFIARLPAPPYSFLDRITATRAEPWKMEAGGEIVAEYDVPPDAWYFAAERQDRMPFAVLLEVALQPCGWMAAYMGSALTHPEALRFRNLGGSARQLVPVTPRTGTLTTTIKVTKISHSAGMIIQHYDFDVRAGGTPVYQGDTYFGYFHARALAEQVGIREASPFHPDPGPDAARRFEYPRGAPFPEDRLRMIDQIEMFLPDGGPNGLGFIEGFKTVDPTEWFFEAHFQGDPVCPGSLGLESFLQLLKVVAVERWGSRADLAFESPVMGDVHRWVYRGQVIPTHKQVVTQAVVTAIDDRRRVLRADGFLSVDGRVIYQMNDFTLGTA